MDRGVVAGVAEVVAGFGAVGSPRGEEEAAAVGAGALVAAVTKEARAPLQSHGEGVAVAGRHRPQERRRSERRRGIEEGGVEGEGEPSRAAVACHVEPLPLEGFVQPWTVEHGHAARGG